MFQNYLKIALRHISRNKGYVFINVIGLGIALACCLIAFVNYQAGENADSYHENYDRLFMVVANGVGYTQPTADVSSALVPLAAEELSGVEAGVRFDKRGVTIQYGDAVFGEGLALADANFLDVFTFNVLAGDVNAMKDPSKILITKKQAKKYFDEETAIGKILTINPGQEGERQLEVGAVIEDVVAQSSSVRFEFLTNINFLETGPRPDTLSNWSNRVNASFVLLKNPADEAQVTQQLAKYIDARNQHTKWKRTKYLLEPMNGLFMKGNDINNNRLGRAVHPAFYWGPGIMALMILLTACLNFTNTTISFSNKRLKEMGVRKVMGGGRMQLMFQLLGESLVICLLAVAVGVILAEYLTPFYNAMWSSMDLALSLDYFQNTGLWVFIGSMILITTLLGGAYPAFYISSFRPSHIFRGNTKFGGDNWLIRSLLGFQIIISLVSIIGGITFAQNAAFQKSYDLGYNVDGVINVQIRNEEEYTRFKNVISENPSIQRIAGGRNNLGFGNWNSNVGNPEDNRSAQTHLIGEDFLEVMGLNLVAGRTFDKNLETDFTESVLVTQKFVKEWQWDNPIGQKIKHYYGNEKKVIGVVEDFYASSFFDKPTAGVFHFMKPDQFRVMKINVGKNNLVETNNYLKEKWTQHLPLVPFNSYYQDEALMEATMITDNVSFLYLFLAIISVLLAATGLFSLVSLNVLKRAKEIAIRRVLGATAENITYTINKHYFLVFAIGGIIGALLGGWFAGFLIDQIFKVTQGVSLISTILAVLAVCLVGGLTIGGKLLAVLQTNPAETLKSE